MAFLKGKMLSKVFLYIQLELVLKMNYPIIWLARNLVVSSLVKELAAHTKPTMNIIFIINTYFQQKFFLHLFVYNLFFSKLNQTPNQISNQNISKTQGNYDK
jgi:hypothetical protein